MVDNQGPTHIVVDGSNLATEGRSMPSLAQLEEAVASYMDEHPDVQVTVVVDATFAHRIDKSESARYEEGVENNELVAPPAGAVGRGDAFVLGIADKANSVVLSNDSFQEFHGEYPWLFDEGRLVGGKPVPHVGWVWVERNPVRGPISRKATRGSKDAKPSRSGGRSRGGSRKRSASTDASQPMPVPTAPPPGVTGNDAPAKRAASKSRGDQPDSGGAERKDVPKRGEPVNELMPFLDFVEQHPVGTTVNGVVDAYSSHGAYVTIGDVRGYVPLRMMSDPPPRSAKKAVAMGDTFELVVVSFAPARRSIDCALPAMADRIIAEMAADAKVDEGSEDEVTADEAIERSSSRGRRRRGGRGRSTRTSVAGTSTDASPAEQVEAEAPAPEPTETAAKRSVAKKTAVKKSAAKKSAAKKAAAKKTAAKKTAAKKTAAKKTAVKKTAAKKSAVKKTASTKPETAAPAVKKAATKKTAAKKTAAKKAAAKKTPVKKTAAKKTSARKSTAKKAVAKKTPAKKSAAKGS